MRSEDELSKEDLERVNKYLNSGYNRVERKPPRLWLLFGVVWAVIAGLGLLSWWLSSMFGTY